jgi:hypothetical protein
MNLALLDTRRETRFSTKHKSGTLQSGAWVAVTSLVDFVLPRFQLTIMIHLD